MTGKQKVAMYDMKTRILISWIQAFINHHRQPDLFGLPDLDEAEAAWKDANAFNVSAAGESEEDEVSKIMLITVKAFMAKDWNEAVAEGFDNVELRSNYWMSVLRKVGDNLSPEQSVQIRKCIEDGNISGAQKIILNAWLQSLG